MTANDWGTVRDCMTTEITEVDGRLDVLSALRIMKGADTTALIVKRRSENDEYGMLLFSDIAKQVIAKDRAPERVNVYEIRAKPILMVRPDMGRYLPMSYNAPISTQYWDDDGSPEYKQMFERIERDGVVLEK